MALLTAYVLLVGAAAMEAQTRQLLAVRQFYYSDVRAVSTRAYGSRAWDVYLLRLNLEPPTLESVEQLVFMQSKRIFEKSPCSLTMFTID